MTSQPRKFHIRSYNNRHTVYEIMPRGGERAVSPSFNNKEEAGAALAHLTCAAASVPYIETDSETAYGHTALTYTVTNRHGTEQGRGLSLTEAAQTLLGYDGHEFDICPASGGGFNLFTSRFSRNSTTYDGVTQSSIYSAADARAAAEAEIFAKVIKHAERFCGCTAMTDTDYDAMLAETGHEAETRD